MSRSFILALLLQNIYCNIIISPKGLVKADVEALRVKSGRVRPVISFTTSLITFLVVFFIKYEDTFIAPLPLDLERR